MLDLCSRAISSLEVPVVYLKDSSPEHYQLDRSHPILGPYIGVTDYCC